MGDVGIMNAWRIRRYNQNTGWAKTGDSTALAWGSLGTGAGLSPVILNGTQDLPGISGISISQAMSIPPIARAVMMYTGVVTGQPLLAEDQAGAQVDIPWLTTTGTGAVTAGLRNAQMVQDIFFAGHTLLQVTRDAAGLVEDAIRLPLDRWKLDQDGYVLVDDVMVDQESVVYIPGLLPFGFLTYAAGTIRHYDNMVRTLESRTANPVPLIAIHVEDDCPLTDEEIEDVLDDWAEARKSKHGAVAVVPKGIRIEVLGDQAGGESMLTEGRNAARLDVANFVNLTAALVDGNNGTSGTYENTLQNQNEFNALSLPLWTLPIELRLSQDDVTPAGVSVRFDSSKFDSLPSLAKGNTGTAIEAPATPTPETGSPTE